MSSNRYTDKYIISLLRSVLNGTTPEEFSDDIDWSRFITVASENYVSNMLCYAVDKLENKPPKAVCDFLFQAHTKALLRDATQQAETENIIRLFSDSAIRCLPLKGYSLKKYYPSSDMRYMSDLDIFIDAENVEKARCILENLGYTFEFCGKVHDNYIKKPIMHIEVHKFLMDDDMPDIAEYYNVADGFSKGYRVSDSSLEYALSDEEFYIYMISHSAKHYLTFGTGIFSVMDIYIFLNKMGDGLNYSYIDTQLKKVRLTSLNKKLVSLANVWFGNGKSDKTIEQMSNYIITSGSYGKFENEVLHKFLNSCNSKKSLFSNKVRYFFFMIFPNVEYMSGKYPKVKNKPYLLPFYWVKRWFSSIFFNRESISLRLFSVLRAKKDITDLHIQVKDD